MEECENKVPLLEGISGLGIIKGLNVITYGTLTIKVKCERK